MKKLMILTAAAVLLAGCGDTTKMDKLIEQQENSKPDSTAEMPDSSSADDTSSTGWSVGSDYSKLDSDDSLEPIKSYAEMYGIDAANDGFDVDLTILDASMTYAQVFDMMYNPSLYEGKKVRAVGNFAHTEENGKDYFAVIIKDATACCAQGLEFDLQGDYSYPEDFPEEEAELVVWGDFTSYEEGGYTYIELENAKMLPVAG